MTEQTVIRRMSEEEMAARDTIIAIFEEIGNEMSVAQFLIGMVAAMLELVEAGSQPGEAETNRRKLAEMLVINAPDGMREASAGRVQ